MDDVEVKIWTDSTIVLDWVKSESSCLKVFVGNRVSEIQSVLSPAAILWVPTDENPADLPSRGIWPLDEKQETFYLHGPIWLKDRTLWPEQPAPKKAETELKTKKVTVSVVDAEPSVFELERFSDLDRMVESLCYVFRFIGKQGVQEWHWDTSYPSVEERRKKSSKISLWERI
jgi:hypothetical protein